MNNRVLVQVPTAPEKGRFYDATQDAFVERTVTDYFVALYSSKPEFGLAVELWPGKVWAIAAPNIEQKQQAAETAGANENA